MLMASVVVRALFGRNVAASSHIARRCILIDAQTSFRGQPLVGYSRYYSYGWCSWVGSYPVLVLAIDCHTQRRQGAKLFMRVSLLCALAALREIWNQR